MSMESSCLPSQFNFKGAILRETGRNYGRALPGFVKLRKYPTNSINVPTRLCLATSNGGSRQKTHGVGSRDGVIIVDHGSRRKESNIMLNEFVVMFREKTGYSIVEPAHMELAEPSIKNALASCVQQGVNRVIVSPFFLFPGRHWHQDIPSLTAEAAKEHPGVSYIITAPLGLHELLMDLNLVCGASLAGSVVLGLVSFCSGIAYSMDGFHILLDDHSRVGLSGASDFEEDQHTFLAFSKKLWQLYSLLQLCLRSGIIMSSLQPNSLLFF